MSIESGFTLLLMLCLLAYTAYRWFVRRDVWMVAVLAVQIMICSLAFICFITNTHTSNMLQALFIGVGILLPGWYLWNDFRSAVKKVREHGIFDGFVEKPDKPKEEDVITDEDGNISDISPEESPSRVIMSLNVDEDEIIKNVKRNLVQAQGLIKRNELDKALDIYNSLTAVIRNSPSLFFNLGNLYYRTGMYNIAVKNYKKALDASKKIMKQSLKTADDMILPQRQRSEETSDVAGKLGDNSIIYYNLGNAYFKKGDYQEAIDSYKEALLINPALDSAEENTARALMWLGRFEEATEYFKRLCESNPDNFRAHLNLGTIYSDMKRYDEAIEELNDAVRLNPNSKLAYHALGRVYVKTGRYDEAVEIYNKYISKYPGEYKAYYNKGMALYNQNKNEEAITAFRKAVDIQPDYHEALYNMGVVLDEMGRMDEAVEVFREVIELRPDFLNAYNNLGIILSTSGRYLEALNVYMKGLKRNPNSYSLYYNMGMTLFDMNRYEDAAETFRSAIEIKSDEYEVYYYHGLALTQIERYSEAAEAYRKAVKYKPDYSECYYNLAAVYSIMRKYDAALENLRKAVELDQDLKDEAKADKVFNVLREKPEFEEIFS